MNLWSVCISPVFFVSISIRGLVTRLQLFSSCPWSTSRGQKTWDLECRSSRFSSSVLDPRALKTIFKNVYNKDDMFLSVEPCPDMLKKDYVGWILRSVKRMHKEKIYFVLRSTSERAFRNISTFKEGHGVIY